MDHAIQLFDSHTSATNALSAFIKDGLSKGERVLVVVRGDDWNRAAVRLTPDRRQLALWIGSGRLTVVNAAATLDAVIVRGMPAAERFDVNVRPLVGRCAERTRRLRVYGDAVDILAADGNFEAAERLEELWSALQRQIRFSLLCAYSSSSFGERRTHDALRRIRHLHSHHVSFDDDVMATALMEEVTH